MEQLTEILVPLGVVVALPVLIVWIVNRTANNKINKNAEVIIKAIENNSAIDTDKLVEALGTRHRTPRQLLNLRLLRGCIFSLVGIAVGIYCLIVWLADIMGSGIMSYFFVAMVCLAIGGGYLITYFLTRKTVE